MRPREGQAASSEFDHIFAALMPSQMKVCGMWIDGNYKTNIGYRYTKNRARTRRSWQRRRLRQHLKQPQRGNFVRPRCGKFVIASAESVISILCTTRTQAIVLFIMRNWPASHITRNRGKWSVITFLMAPDCPSYVGILKKYILWTNGHCELSPYIAWKMIYPEVWSYCRFSLGLTRERGLPNAS